MSNGRRVSEQGPGLQKRTKLQRKYLTDKKMQVKKGSMATLDFGVEKAPKLSTEEQQTGLRGRTAPAGTVRTVRLHASMRMYGCIKTHGYALTHDSRN
jgi:hypothetical protein